MRWPRPVVRGPQRDQLRLIGLLRMRPGGWLAASNGWLTASPCRCCSRSWTSPRRYLQTFDHDRLTESAAHLNAEPDRTLQARSASAPTAGRLASTTPDAPRSAVLLTAAVHSAAGAVGLRPLWRNALRCRSWPLPMISTTVRVSRSDHGVAASMIRSGSARTASSVTSTHDIPLRRGVLWCDRRLLASRAHCGFCSTNQTPRSPTALTSAARSRSGLRAASIAKESNRPRKPAGHSGQQLSATG